MKAIKNTETNKIVVNYYNKSISIKEKISFEDFFKELTKMWVKHSILLNFPFPIRQKNKKHLLCNGWVFDSIQDYKNLLDIEKLDIEKPIMPLVPSQTITYKTKQIGNLIRIEDILSNVPKEINYKSAYLTIENNNIVLKIGGVWPNPNHKSEMKTFKRLHKEFEKSYKQYLEIQKIKNEKV